MNENNELPEKPVEKKYFPKENEYFFGGLIKINLSEMDAYASDDPMFIEKGIL